MHPYFQPLEPEGMYHIYNRGNNGENLFYKTENYAYFLKKFDRYLSPVLEVYCYCLLPNHFHFLIKVKSETDLQKDTTIQQLYPLNTPVTHVVSEQFRRFFLSYAKSIKEQEGRTGSLFEKNFKRKLAANNEYAVRVINYIHRNPETHGLVKDFRHYRHSSYRSLLSDAPTRLQRSAVMELFGGREAFTAYHEANVAMKFVEHFE